MKKTQLKKVYILEYPKLVLQLGPSSAETGNEIRSQDESSTQEKKKEGDQTNCLI
jgi:hypothetical protein